MAAMRLPLEGVRVLDLTVWQQGTYASALLADLGADVVKVEEPVTGDPGRGLWSLPPVALSSYFEAHNRGKRSIALDLKQPRGRDVFLRLAATADVFINNFRPSVIARLGLAYDAVRVINPAIIYVQASGYGPQGPEADAGAFDMLAQARSGFAALNGEPDDPPLPTPVPIADQAGALHACIAALAGLAGRAATGQGAKYDTSLLGSMISLQSFDVTNYLFTNIQRPRPYRGGTRPFWRAYQGGDGAWFVIGMLLDRAWDDVCGIIGRPELAGDERFDSFQKRTAENAGALIDVLDGVFSTAPALHWVDRLNGCGMFASLVQDYAALAGDPQALANAYIHEVPRPGGDPVRMAGAGIAIDGEPVRIRSLAPALGAHTEEVLLEAGFTWDEIVRLREEGVAGPARER